jgi:DNA-dependent RNA polymerase auxiliary subunit epsilon
MNTASDNKDLNIANNEYVAFDALSLRSFITSRLNNSGIITDQNYEGSNITAINNIIAYAFHVLLYYQNQTATESLFSEAQLYENMNRIVKQLNYAPIGVQTSTLSFSVSAGAGLTTGYYTIPRYTLIRAGNATYSFNEDITFTKVLSDATEELTSVGNQYLLYQGNYIEYPLYTARGESNEIVYLIPGANVTIDHFNIDVYIKKTNSTGKWTKWNKTESLYLQNATDTSYEIRLNSNKNYEIKFGDNINGAQLNVGDVVAVYYLQSAGTGGEVGAGAINGQSAALYTTGQFALIQPDVTSSDLNLLTDVNILNLQFANTSISTSYTDIESVDSIRSNAPASFKSQYRVVTANDYKSFIKNNFANIINDVAVLNNNDYLNKHLRYLYTIGLTNPGVDYRVLYNQMAFADACNFNNVYIYVLPKATKLLTNNYVNYLTPAQKQLITSTVADKKALTSEVVVMDPVYLAVTTGTGVGNVISTNDISSSKLVVTLNRGAKTPISVVKSNIQSIFQNYFNPSSLTLGCTISVSDITGSILALTDVQSVQTINSTEVVNGVSLIVYNPSYPSNDITSTSKTFTVQPFQTVYLNDINELLARVVVQYEASQNASIINY